MATDSQSAGKVRKFEAEKAVMLRRSKIISNGAKAPAPSQGNDWHDVTVHHRYYGSGERIVETRQGSRPRAVNVCGF
jgi:hypothetical protein